MNEGDFRAPRRPVTLEELAALNDEIAALIRAGMPLETGLRRYAENSGGEMTQLTQRLSAHLSQGKSLTEALVIEQHSVPPLYRAIVVAGAHAGRLPEALETLATFVRTIGGLRREIGLALVYPSVVVVMAYLLAIGFLEFLVPRYRAAFADVGYSATRVVEMLSVNSEALRNWFWVPPVLFVAAMWWWSRSEGRILKPGGATTGGGIRLDAAMCWIPGVGRVVTSARRAAFCEMLALLIENNVPLPQAFELASAAIGDRKLVLAAERVGARLENGHSLGESLELGGGIPPLLAWMLQVGEQQGQVAQMVRESGALYRSRAAGGADWCRTILPIVLVAVIGGCVTMAYGWMLFYPMTQLMRALNTGWIG